jgi:hypothetical protein
MNFEVDMLLSVSNIVQGTLNTSSPIAIPFWVETSHHKKQLMLLEVAWECPARKSCRGQRGNGCRSSWPWGVRVEDGMMVLLPGHRLLLVSRPPPFLPLDTDPSCSMNPVSLSYLECCPSAHANVSFLQNHSVTQNALGLLLRHLIFK